MANLTRWAVTTPTGAVDIDRRTVAVVASNADIDRQADRIMPGAWRLENFKRNPVILWGHDHATVPIAKCSEIATTPGGELRAVIQFPPEGRYPQADLIFNQLSDGYLNAVSIGAHVVKMSQAKGDRARRGGQDIEALELLEISIVSVPANAATLVIGRGQTTPAATATAAATASADSRHPGIRRARRLMGLLT